MNQDSSRSHSIFTITVESSSAIALQENTGIQQVSCLKLCLQCNSTPRATQTDEQLPWLKIRWCTNPENIPSGSQQVSTRCCRQPCGLES